MPPKLPDEYNPYSDSSPFDVLGVSPSASGRDIVDARDDKLEDIEFDFKDDPEERLNEAKKVKAAYDVISDPRSRFGLEMFRFDPSVGQSDCREAADRRVGTEIDVSGVFEDAEDIFRDDPIVGQPKKQFRKVKFEHSVRLETAKHPFEVNPAGEAMQSIRFDR